MKRLPKDKISLSIYVSPECKEKLECLQQLYFIAGRRFSLSELVEDSVHISYAGAYLSQEGGFWKSLFRLNKFINFEAFRLTLDKLGLLGKENNNHATT